jgi:glycosyltransferase involved in cell wall biosynthesis
MFNAGICEVKAADLHDAERDDAERNDAVRGSTVFRDQSCIPSTTAAGDDIRKLQLQWITQFWPTARTTSYGSFVYDCWRAVRALSSSAIPVYMSVPFPNPLRPASRRLVAPIFGGEPGSMSARVAGRAARPIVRRRVSSLDGSALHLHGGLGLRQVLSVRAETPVFLHVHGRVPKETLEDISRSEKSSSRQLVLLPVSEHICEQLGLRDRASAVRVLRNGYDSELFFPPRNHHSGDEIRVVSVGNLEEHKNIGSVIKAVSLLRQSGTPAVLTVVGSGRQRRSLERLTSDLGITEAVRFAGQQPPEEVARLMRAADVFALPSRQEAFGVVFSEALASGLAVIGGAETGACEAIGDHGVLVEPDDIVRLAVEIESGAATTRKRGVSAMRSLRDWNSAALELLGIYSEFGLRLE